MNKSILGPAKIREINLSRRQIPCPICGTMSKRHSNQTRTLKEIGTSCPIILKVKYSKHYCIECRKHVAVPLEHLAKPSARYTNRVMRTAVRLIKDGMSLEQTELRMRVKYKVHVPSTTMHDWYVNSICND